MHTTSPSLTQLISLSLALAVTSAGCAVSTHAVAPATMGVVRSSADLEADLDQPGPVVLETVVGAEWEVDRSGLLALGDPVAKAAPVGDGPEPIQIYFHVLRHPTRGTFLVDTGVEHLLRD